MNQKSSIGFDALHRSGWVLLNPREPIALKVVKRYAPRELVEDLGFELQASANNIEDLRAG